MMRGIKRITGACLLAVVAAASPVRADTELAVSMGGILASEDFCGLAYDQAAITAYIEKHVKAEDLEFATDLQLYTSGQKSNLQEMTNSEKTAWCTQTRRSAKNMGFVK